MAEKESESIGSSGLCSSNSNIETELCFLISKYLSQNKFRNTAKVFQKEIENNEVIPKRLDWIGNEHSRSYAEYEAHHKHIDSGSLYRLLGELINLVDHVNPTYPFVKTSLLGIGSQSLLRNRINLKETYKTVKDVILKQNRDGNPRLAQRENVPNRLQTVVAREICGATNKRLFTTVEHYSRIELFARNVGHLSSIYCVLLDKTGRFIITGADDTLVKIWSVRDGRLLFTLRGASAEISDLAIDAENALLAAGSCDKIIRVWSLQTFAPVAVLGSHTGIVTALQFCPSPKHGVLVSTGGDGCVCFWSYHKADSGAFKFERKPLKLNEKVRPGHGQLICASFSSGGKFLSIGGADHIVRIYHLSLKNGVDKLLETEIHSDRVDSIQWRHSGIGFVSGSRDGTALIWYYETQQWRTVALKMTQTLPGISIPDEKLKRLQVTMVGWDKSDRYVLTASSDHLVRIWDSQDGTLVRILEGHEDNVYIIEAHPTKDCLFLTVGHDGLLFVWDINTGKQVVKFKNSIEGQGHGALFDAKWDPTGMAITATDSYGHILIFGIGSNFLYKKIPQELFFHTDYRPLVRDANHYVLDEQTQLAPHLMPPPFLVNIDGNPYPPACQRLVPGRENCREDQLVPNVLTNDNGDPEILDLSVADEAAVAATSLSGDRSTAALDAVEPRAGPSAGSRAAENGHYGPCASQSRRTIDEMIEQLALRQERDRQILSRGEDVPQPGPSGSYSSHQEVRESGASAIVRTALESSSPDHSYAEGSAFRTSAANMTSPRSGRVGTRREGDIEGVRQSTGDWERDPHIKWKRRIYIPRLSSGSLAEVVAFRESQGEHEEAMFDKEDKNVPMNSFDFSVSDQMDLNSVKAKRRQRKTHTYSTRANPEEDIRPNMTKKSKRGRPKSGTVHPSSRNGSREGIGHHTQENADEDQRRGRINSHERENESEIESEFSQQDSSFGSSSSSTSSDEEDEEKSADSSEYSDWTAEVRNVGSPLPSVSAPSKPSSSSRLVPPKRTAQKQKKLVHARRTAGRGHKEKDGTALAEVSTSTSCNSVSAERRSRRNLDKNKETGTTETSPVRSRRRLGTRFVNFAESDIDDGGEIPPAYRIPDWLSETVPKKAPYFPQMGDELIYLRQGHRLYVQAVLARGKYPLDQRALPWFRRLDLKDEEHVKIVGIKYEICPPRLCCLKLCVLDGEQLTSDFFTVKYHDMEDVLDFLVLKTTYDVAVSRIWNEGDRFRCIIDDAWWVGTLEGRDPYESERPESSFLCYRVLWDNNERERLSPWDMEPIVDGAKLPFGGGSVRVSPKEYKALVYTPSSAEWAGQSFESECQRIAGGIGKIMELSVAEPFLAPVDLNEYPNYAMVVAYPIDLSTIKSRLESHFYRRPNAAQFDVRYIATNAELFNKCGSVIVKNGRVVTELALRLIQSPECTDPTIFYHEVLNQCEKEQPDIEQAKMSAKDGSSSSVPAEPKRRGRRKNSSPKNWLMASQELLKNMFERQDSVPFRYPVNLDRYKDYNQIIDIPMDLSSIKETLEAEGYDAPSDFASDVRLVFSNSKLYNTNNKSRIYSMTLRLEAFFEDQIKNILNGCEAEAIGKCPTNQMRGRKALSPRTRRSKRVANLRIKSESESDSEEYAVPPPCVIPRNRDHRFDESVSVDNYSDPDENGFNSDLQGRYPSKSGGKKNLVKKSKNQPTKVGTSPNRTSTSHQSLKSQEIVNEDLHDDSSNFANSDKEHNSEGDESTLRRSRRQRKKVKSSIQGSTNEDQPKCLRSNRTYLKKNELESESDLSDYRELSQIIKGPICGDRLNKTVRTKPAIQIYSKTEELLSSREIESIRKSTSECEEASPKRAKKRTMILGEKKKSPLTNEKSHIRFDCKVNAESIAFRKKSTSQRIRDSSSEGDSEINSAKQTSRCLSFIPVDQVKTRISKTRKSCIKDYLIAASTDVNDSESDSKAQRARLRKSKRNRSALNMFKRDESEEESATDIPKNSTLKTRTSSANRKRQDIKRIENFSDVSSHESSAESIPMRRRTTRQNASKILNENASDDSSVDMSSRRKRKRGGDSDSKLSRKFRKLPNTSSMSEISQISRKTRSKKNDSEFEIDDDEEEETESDEYTEKAGRSRRKKSRSLRRGFRDNFSENDSWDSDSFMDDSSYSTDDSELHALNKAKERKKEKAKQARIKLAKEKAKALEREKLRKAKEKDKIKKIKQREREKTEKLADQKAKILLAKSLKQREIMETRARKTIRQRKTKNLPNRIVNLSPENQNYVNAQFVNANVSPAPIHMYSKAQHYYQHNISDVYSDQYCVLPNMDSYNHGPERTYYPIQNGAISTTSQLNQQSSHSDQYNATGDFIEEREEVGKTGRLRRRVQYNENSDDGAGNVSSRGRVRRVNSKMRDYI